VKLLKLGLSVVPVKTAKFSGANFSKIQLDIQQLQQLDHVISLPKQTFPLKEFFSPSFSCNFSAARKI